MSNIKDFGNWVVPTCWEEVSLKQLLDIDAEKALEDTSLVKILSILTKKPMNVVEQLPVEFVNSILGKMTFIAEQPEYGTSCSIEIDGEVYSVNVKEKLKLGEWVAFNALSDSDPYYVAKVLAIVCRKDGELYDSQYENEVLPERIDMFLNAPCVKCLPVVAFFL